MRHALIACAALALSFPVAAEDAPHPSPGEIVAQAAADEWVAIPARELLVMTLAPDADGNARQVVIQLMPAPFSQGWIDNIRLFARSGWYDGISVNRVQDNYVVQWGDPNYDNPEATGATKPLPEGLKVVGEEHYVVDGDILSVDAAASAVTPGAQASRIFRDDTATQVPDAPEGWHERDSYAEWTEVWEGWPLANRQVGQWLDENGKPMSRPMMPRHEASGRGFYYDVSESWFWPVHCYGMVGVGRNLSPDTGSGAELYTVIGHAPRHLDRNIALVGRVIEGMEHLSSLPRGKGALGFYGPDEVHKRTPILTVRVASDLAAEDQPKFEYLSTEGETFARYAEARANRRDPFFNVPAGGADICNIPVPIRRVAD